MSIKLNHKTYWVSSDTRNQPVSVPVTPTIPTMTNDSQEVPIPNRHLSSSMTRRSGRLRLSLISGRGTAGGNSWLDGKATPLARIVGNLWKDLKMRRTWYRHGGQITCQGRNFLLFFQVTLRFALLPLRMALRSTMMNRRWTWDSGSPIWTLIMIARRFRFLCYMFKMMFSFCLRGVTGMGTGWFRVSFWYSVCFMIEFDTHDVLCLVLSIVLILSLFYVSCQDIVWYLMSFM